MLCNSTVRSHHKLVVVAFIKCQVLYKKLAFDVVLVTTISASPLNVTECLYIKYNLICLDVTVHKYSLLLANKYRMARNGWIDNTPRYTYPPVPSTGLPGRSCHVALKMVSHKRAM